MRGIKIILSGVAFCILCWSFSIDLEGQPQNKRDTSFTLPIIPATLTSPELRAEYLVMHYWDNFNFSDTSLINMSEVTEQAFVDFINVFPYSNNNPEAIVHMLDCSAVSDSMFSYFLNLSEKYLYDSNSPMRNEELYIPVLKYAIASNRVDTLCKNRLMYQLKMANKNRLRMVAADFTYTLPNGKTGNLSDIKSDYTILFFNWPDCHDCKIVKQFIANSPLLLSLVGQESKSKRVNLAILAIYAGGDIPLWRSATYPKTMINSYDASQYIIDNQLYDLKIMPTLYLLDKDKRVILKDASIKAIEAWLEHVDK